MAFNPGVILEPLPVRYPDEVFADALTVLQARLPNWQPRNAAIEVILLEALSLTASEVSATGDAVVGAVTEGLLSTLYQVPRLTGAAATGQITLTFDSTVTTTIPAGIRFLLTDYDTEVYVTADTTVTAASSVILDVETSVSTAVVNGVGAGAVVDLIDAVPNALSAAVSTAFSNGADPEDDAAYLARATQRLARVTNSLVVTEHFSAYVLEDGRATNALAIPAWDGVDVASIGTDAGHVTVVTYGKGGQLSSTVRAELAAAMQAITYAGATVHVNEVDVEAVDVTVTVKAAPGFTSSQVQTAAVTAIENYLNPQTWPIGDDVIVGALEAALVLTAEVEYIVTTDAPAADITLAADQVAAPGTITVSVT